MKIINFKFAAYQIKKEILKRKTKSMANKWKKILPHSRHTLLCTERPSKGETGTKQTHVQFGYMVK